MVDRIVKILVVISSVILLIFTLGFVTYNEFTNFSPQYNLNLTNGRFLNIDYSMFNTFNLINYE